MTEDKLSKILENIEKLSPSLNGFKDQFYKETNNFDSIQRFLNLPSEEEKEEEKEEKKTQTETKKQHKKEANEFILINNIGMNVSKISSFGYNNVEQEIYIVIEENREEIWCWFVPSSEGMFILNELQKTLNERKNFNFHFSRPIPKSLWNDFTQFLKN